LLDVDREGLSALIAWLQTTASSAWNIAINRCPGAVVQSGLHVDLSCVPEERGLVRTSGTEFVWQRSAGMGRSHRQVGRRWKAGLAISISRAQATTCRSWRCDAP
jgi:hypothetical protein